MKIQNIENTENFFNLINGCKGKVEFETGNGNRLNLKSKFCQYALTKALSGGHMKELEVIASDKEDMIMIFNNMVVCVM